MPIPDELMSQIIDRIPGTIQDEPGVTAWMNNALKGKTYDQLSEEVQSDTFGLSSDNFMHYAGQEINELQKTRRDIATRPMNAAEQIAIQDTFRQLSGTRPLNYLVTKESAVPINPFLQRLYSRQADRSASTSFGVGFYRSFQNLGTGLIGTIAPEYAAEIQNEADIVLGGNGGLADWSGELFGTAVQIAGLAASGSVVPALTLTAPALFSASTFGSTRTDVERERVKGAKINIAQELGSATLNAAAEFIFERFGGKMTMMAGRALAPVASKTTLGILGKQLFGGNPAGAVGIMKMILAKSGGALTVAMVGGGAEEMLTTIAQNTVTNIYRDQAVFEGVKKSGAAGALMPLLVGGLGSLPSAGRRAFGHAMVDENLSYERKAQEISDARAVIKDSPITNGVKNMRLGQLDAIQSVLADEKVTDLGRQIEVIEQNRDKLRGNTTMPDGEKDARFGQMDAAIAGLRTQQKFVSDDIVSESQMLPKITPIEPVPETSIAATVEHVRTKIPKSMNTPSKVSKLLPMGLKKTYEILKKRAAMLHYNALRFDRISQVLDGGVDGPIRQTIYDPLNNAAINTAISERKIRTEFIERTSVVIGTKKEQRAFITNRVTAIDQGGKEHNFTGDELLTLYMQNKNEKGRRYLLSKNAYNFSEVQIDDLLGRLTENEIRLAEEVILPLYKNYDPLLRQTSKDVDGIEVGSEENYSPIRRVKSSGATNPDFLDALLDKNRTGEAMSARQAFQKERQGVADSLLHLSALENVAHYVARAERYLEMAPVVKVLRPIFSNPPLKKAINDRTSNQGHGIMTKWAEITIRGNSGSERDALGPALKFLRRKGITAALGFNMITSSKQTISLLMAQFYDPKMHYLVPKNLLSMNMPGVRKKMVDFVLGSSKYMQQRSFDRDLREVHSEAQAKGLIGRKDRFDEAAMSAIRFMDTQTAITAWKSFYDLSLMRGTSDSDAVAFADKMTARTQPAANVQDLPMFFHGGAVSKLFTTFQNQINQSYNFIAVDILQEAKVGDISKTQAAHRSLGLLMSAFALGMVDRGFEIPDDLEEVVGDLGHYLISMIPIAGGAINSAIDGFGGSTIANTLPAAFVKTIKDVARDDPRWADAGIHAYQTLAFLLGLPANQPIRTAKGIVDLASGKTQDPRRLIFSESALSENEDERATGISVF